MPELKIRQIMKIAKEPVSLELPVGDEGDTMLVAAARAAGCVVIDGREALVRQGAKSFELWTGLRAPVDAMRAAVESR